MIVVATFKIKPEALDDFKAAITKVQEHVIANEPGTISYRVVQSVKKPEQWVVVEEYKDKEAFKAHGKGEAIGQLLKSMPKFGSADVQVSDEL